LALKPESLSKSEAAKSALLILSYRKIAFPPPALANPQHLDEIAALEVLDDLY